jgi:hypothetical protein
MKIFNISSKNFIKLKSNNQIGDEGCKGIGICLKNLENLTSININLDFNIIDGIGCRALMSAFIHLQNLIQLNVSFKYLC